MTNIVLIDDHILLRNGLAELVRSLGYNVLFEANNGKDFIEKLKVKFLPEVVLLDINMPEMDGYQTAQWIKNNYPGIKVLALSMYDNEGCIIRMLRSGANGYILKDCEPAQLKTAINAIITKGYYYSELVSGKLMGAINQINDQEATTILLSLTQRELDFLKLICSELTYKEISRKMAISERSVDKCRDVLFDKINVRSRVGLAVYAIKNGIVNLH